jgi:hypothetical protein
MTNWTDLVVSCDLQRILVVCLGEPVRQVPTFPSKDVLPALPTATGSQSVVDQNPIKSLRANTWSNSRPYCEPRSFRRRYTRN